MAMVLMANYRVEAFGREVRPVEFFTSGKSMPASKDEECFPMLPEVSIYLVMKCCTRVG